MEAIIVGIRSFFHHAHPESARDTDNEVNAEDMPGDRRHLLKILGATAVGAVGASLLEAAPAGATPGSAVLASQSNSSDATTEIDTTSGSGLQGMTSDTGAPGLFGVVTATSGILPGVSAGVLGDSTTEYGVVGTSTVESGVYGVAGGSSGLNDGNLTAGLLGDSNATDAVIGFSSAAHGVTGVTSADSSSGVFGEDVSPGSTAFGVLGLSENGIGIQAQGGLAPIQLVPSGTAGAPTTGTAVLGEMYVDSNGVFYKCLVAGTPGTWVPMYSSIPLLTPIRVFDSRTSKPPAAPSRAVGPVVGGTTQPLQITGASVGGVEVPSGAVGVIGNVTVVHAVASGYLTLYPDGVARPTTSSLNYPDANPICNGATVGLSSAGVLEIFAAVTTDVIFDVTGFIA
jgi:hypothetical protein